MAWTALAFSYGSVLTSAKMTQLFDNFAAMAAGNAGSPALTTTQVTTQAVGNNTTAIATTAFCEAGFVNNDNGNIAIGGFVHAAATGSPTAGATVAGSTLYAVDIDTLNSYATLVATSLTGTWRNISGRTLTWGYPGWCYTGIFQRIS